MLKVSIFLFVSLACVFNVYAIRHIYIQTQEIKKLKVVAGSDIVLRECLDTGLVDYLDAAALDRSHDFKIVTTVKKCLRTSKNE